MTKLAFGAEPRVEVSDVEQHLPRPSYTLNTLVYLRKRNPHAEFRLIVGTDILPELPHWHQSEEVTKLAPLLLFRRRGTSSLEGIDAELPEVSSSEVRTCLTNLPRDMERLRSLVPGPVLEHILSHSLYLT